MQDQSKFQEAEAMLKEAVDLREAVWSPNHPNVAESLKDLADLYLLWYEAG